MSIGSCLSKNLSGVLPALDEDIYAQTSSKLGALCHSEINNKNLDEIIIKKRIFEAMALPFRQTFTWAG